jgi:hypothetical protein
MSSIDSYRNPAKKWYCRKEKSIFLESNEKLIIWSTFSDLPMGRRCANYQLSVKLHPDLSIVSYYTSQKIHGPEA